MGTDDARPVPLQLGTVRSEASGTGGTHGGADRPTPPWQRWVGLAAALLAGAVIGIVVNDARNEAAQYAQVALVRGMVDIEVGSPLSSGRQTLTVNLLNTGPRALDVLAVEVDGFTPAGDDSDAAPVTAEPGEWVRVQTMVDPDCTTRPPGTLRVQVRTGSGEQTVAVTGQPGDDQLIWAWQGGCRGTGGAGVFIGEIRTLSADSRGARMVLAVANGHDEPLVVNALETTTPGFAMTTDPLPIEVEPGGVTHVTTVWTVDDCAAASQFTEVLVAVNVRSSAMDTRVSQALDNATLIELVRLTVRSCET